MNHFHELVTSSKTFLKQTVRTVVITEQTSLTLVFRQNNKHITLFRFTVELLMNYGRHYPCRDLLGYKRTPMYWIIPALGRQKEQGKQNSNAHPLDLKLTCDNYLCTISQIDYKISCFSNRRARNPLLVKASDL